jgi:hypothetical protein
MAGKLATFMCRLSRNPGSPNRLEPYGPISACRGTALDLKVPGQNTARSGYELGVCGRRNLWRVLR